MKNHQTGDRYLKKGGKYFRPWAKKSDTQGYIVCTWCNTEFEAKNTTGSNGHENSLTHKNWKEKNEKNLEVVEKNHEKEKSILTKSQRNYQNLRMFEFKLLNICLGKNKKSFFVR